MRETGEVTTSHLLLGIWAQKESAGHKIMATLGFDDDKAKELAKSVSFGIDLEWRIRHPFLLSSWWNVGLPMRCFLNRSQGLDLDSRRAQEAGMLHKRFNKTYEIMQLHHHKHHQTYITNYNKALEQLDEFGCDFKVKNKEEKRGGDCFSRSAFFCCCVHTGIARELETEMEMNRLKDLAKAKLLAAITREKASQIEKLARQISMYDII
ncbi:hypothetical protein M8C21_018410 [Ambrosia artemisiifolia]|uniref:superoxide dismutase n=1 Tax=Ambrosia artemisiifolia TaxID=4212 RepID=A0AAD5CDT0_AMBAR|nr:hypothetical protein M8C21_018410 [Ambrosia artemisiifolia]